VFFKDREHELGSKLLKRIADSTNTYCGDGTTLATFFSTTLIDKSITAVAHGIHPTLLNKGIIKAKESALEIIKQFSIPVTNEKELFNV
jgi:chaperonin GroEL